MVIAAFFIASAVVLLALAVIQAGRNAKHERDRIELEREVKAFLHNAHAKDPEHAEGEWHGMPARIDVDHHAIRFEVTLTPAVIPYRELMARHAPGLERELFELGMSVDAKDRVVGQVPREAELAENLVTVEQRFPVAERVRQLRRFAPAELVERIDKAHSTREIDEILIALTTHFPDAPELNDAIERAAAREHAHPDRVRERAEKWLNREIAPA